jgi:hypothetical protein
MAPQSYRCRCGKNLNGLFNKNCGTDMRHLPSPRVIIFSYTLSVLCLLQSIVFNAAWFSAPFLFLFFL